MELQKYSPEITCTCDGLALWTELLGSLEKCTDKGHDLREVRWVYNLPGLVANTAHRRHANTGPILVDLCTHPGGGGDTILLVPVCLLPKCITPLTMHTRQFGGCFGEGPGSHDLLDSTSCFADGPGSHDPVACFEGHSPSFLSATEMRSSSPNLARWSGNKLVPAAC